MGRLKNTGMHILVNKSTGERIAKLEFKITLKKYEGIDKLKNIDTDSKELVSDVLYTEVMKEFEKRLKDEIKKLL